LTVELYRLADRRYEGDLVQALAGIGGLLGPARWHVKGYRIVYLATSLSLATLEMKVQDMGMKPAYAAFKIIVPDAVSRRPIDKADLPANWRTREAYPECQALGVAWLTGAQETALLLVPSAVVPSETNYLLNPAHAQAGLIKAISLGIVSTDARLLR